MGGGGPSYAGVIPHMKRLAIFALIAILTGCSAAPAPAPASAQPADVAAPPIRITDWIEGTSNLFVEPPLTSDLPTFPALGDRPWSYPGPGLPGPEYRGKADAQDVLTRIATSIDQTGKPDVPPGLPAAFAGRLEGDNYVYHLSGYPPQGDVGPLVYMLKKQPDGWTATPICKQAWAWMWPGTLQQAHAPVVICAYIEGSGANLTLSAYKEGREVLNFSGLADSYVEVIPDPAGGVPTIVALGGYHWLDHKADATVLERYTFTWQNDAYALTKLERQADWVYHIARLIESLAKNQPELAAADFAPTPPAGGVVAYLVANAPDLAKLAAGRWSTDGRRTSTRAYLRPAGAEAGPWFAFDLDEQGRIKAVSQQMEPPVTD